VLLVRALVFLGDLPAAATALREGFSLTGKTSWTVRLRLRAAVVTCRQGNAHLAKMHRARAYELMPALERRFGAFEAPAIVEALLADGEPAAALRLALGIMSTARADPTALDELLVWGARAAADLVEVGQDARDAELVNKAREDLAALISMRDSAPGPPYEASTDTDLVHPALGALFEAERRRATGEGDSQQAWREAARLCEQAGMRWDQHQALWRLSAELVRDRPGSLESAQALRAARHYALEQGATPLLGRVNQTAALGRIPLTDPVTPNRSGARPAAFAALTEREAEVLSQLVANRTNAEIAAQLFISSKTVSVHVSNLLRKTSTGSRREVAALAVRLGWGSSDTRE
jgi:DNA-binding CsgD family transcriptional regulator